MKIVTFANRCLRALIGPKDVGRQPIETSTIRMPTPRQTVSRPVVRWRMNPVSGLECRWTVAGNQPDDGAELSGLERIGAILALRADARPWN